MPDVKIMTSKDVHIALKKQGSGIQWLMKRFGFESEDTLFQTIHKVTPSNADSFIKQLKKREHKKVTQSLERESDEEKEVMLFVEPEATLTQEEEVDECENLDSLEEILPESLEGETSNLEAKDEPSVETLLELQKKEDELSNQLCELEVVHKGLVSTRRQLVSNFLNAKVELEKLRNELKVQEKKLIKWHAEYEACATNMSSLNEEMWLISECLTEVREKIAVLSKVTVFAYSNGSIEVENAEIPLASKVKVEDEFNRLISLPEAEDFTVKAVKLVASVHMMLVSYHSDTEVEVIFEDSKLQNFFNAIS